MFDESAVKALTKAEAVNAAAAAVVSSLREGNAFAAIPNDFAVHDFEPYLEGRRRARGTMSTSVIADFANYARTNAEDGAAVFVDKDAMKAVAVLNLGNPDSAGHADNLAVVALDRSAAFTALLGIANGQPRKQAEVAEFLEDWSNFLSCTAGDEGISVGQAAAAVRKITIEQARNVVSSEQQLGASKSAFESVQASSSEKLPTLIEFYCYAPYFGLSARTFGLRVSVVTADKPLVVLRLIKPEEHKEAMASEFAELVRTSLAGEMPVAIGKYSRS